MFSSLFLYDSQSTCLLGSNVWTLFLFRIGGGHRQAPLMLEVRTVYLSTGLFLVSHLPCFVRRPTMKQTKSLGVTKRHQTSRKQYSQISISNDSFAPCLWRYFSFFLYARPTYPMKTNLLKLTPCKAAILLALHAQWDAWVGRYLKPAFVSPIVLLVPRYDRIF